MRPAPALVATALLLIYVIWGSTYLAVRYALETLPVFGMAGVRFCIAGAVLIGWAKFRGAPWPTAKNLAATSVIGGAMFLGGNGMVVYAEQTLTSSMTALLIAAVPMWMVLFEALVERRRPPTRRIVGLLIGVGGVALLVDPRGGLDPRGVLAMAVSTVTWAGGSIYARRAPLPTSGPMAAGLEMFCGGSLLLVVAGLTGETFGHPSGRSLVAMAYLLVFGSIVAFSAYSWLLRETSSALASTYAFVNPGVAVLVGWAFAGEPVSARMLGAGGIVVIAVIAITTARPVAATAA